MRSTGFLVLVPLLLSSIACPQGRDDDDTDVQWGPQIVHAPATTATEASELPLLALAYAPPESEDPFTLVVTLYYRATGEGVFTDAPMEPTDQPDQFAATIPADVVTMAGVDYYLQALWGADIAMHPDGAPDAVHHVQVLAAPVADPAPLRARYDRTADAIELTWTPPASSAFAGYTVSGQLPGGDPVVVCEGGVPDSACSVPAGGVWDQDYATWTVTVADEGGGGLSDTVTTDGLHLLRGIWVKEHTETELAWGTGEGEFMLPFGIALAGSSVHVVEQGNNRLQTLTDSGDFVGFVGRQGGGQGLPGDGEGEFGAPMDAAISPEGDIYVADHSNARVQVFDGATRQFLFAFGTVGLAEGQLRFPTGLAFDGDGNLHVSESVNARVSVFDAAGTFLSSYSTIDGNSMDFPSRIAWWPDMGAMAISDGTVLRLHAVGEGGTEATWDLLGDLSGDVELGGICITAWGEAIAAVDDPSGTGASDGHRLLLVDGQGAIFGSLGAWGVGDEEFWRPVGCVVGEDGDVWVADGLNHRVKILGP